MSRWETCTWSYLPLIILSTVEAPWRGSVIFDWRNIHFSAIEWVSMQGRASTMCTPSLFGKSKSADKGSSNYQKLERSKVEGSFTDAPEPSTGSLVCLSTPVVDPGQTRWWWRWWDTRCRTRGWELGGRWNRQRSLSVFEAFATLMCPFGIKRQIYFHTQ